MTNITNSADPFIAYFSARFQGHPVESALTEAGWQSDDAIGNTGQAQDCSSRGADGPLDHLEAAHRSLVQVENDRRADPFAVHLASSIIEGLLRQLRDAASSKTLFGKHVADAIASVVEEEVTLQVGTIGEMIAYGDHES